MSTRQATCEERIRGHLDGRLADFRDLRTLADEDRFDADAAERLEIEAVRDSESLRDAAMERRWEYPLGVQTLKLLRIDLSTGGPGDWLEAVVDEGEVSRIVYHFNDWFDHAERTLDGDDFEAARSFVEAFLEI